LGAQAFALVLSFVLEALIGAGTSSANVSVTPTKSEATDSAQLSSDRSNSAHSSLDVEASDRAHGDFSDDPKPKTLVVVTASLHRGVAGADALRLRVGTLQSSTTSMNVFLTQKPNPNGDSSVSDEESSTGAAMDMDINKGTACIILTFLVEDFFGIVKGG
jgi:hypothetical protein